PSIDRSYFNHPGVVTTASSGDDGYGDGLIYPATSSNVVAVGGTSLFLNADNSYNSELTWTGTGSGCASYEPRPIWQPRHDSCPESRVDNDISLVADPNTGVAICLGCSTCCWWQFGGTSISAPIVAALYALAGNVPPDDFQAADVLYRNHSKTNLRDVTKGSNGICQFRYLCNAGKAWDGPTGLGTPDGLGAF
ncbi:MAG TPA: hypothetical protein VHZ29_11455, partial [Rhizomicrobium sp.]|nr:hypothetical protein [Rhizomicrobium sp.]